MKDFFSKCDQIPKKLRIWSHLVKKSLMENVIFCVVKFFIENERNRSQKNFQRLIFGDLFF